MPDEPKPIEIDMVNLTKSEYDAQIKAAKIEAENAMLKKQLPINISGGEVKHKTGFALATLAYAKYNDIPVLEAAKKIGEMKGQSALSDYFVSKMNTLTEGAGGVFVTNEILDDIIPALRDDSDVLSMGTQYITTKGNQIQLRSPLDGGEAYYVGEGETSTNSDMSGGIKKYDIHKLIAQVIIPNDLLRFAPDANLNQRIEEQLIYKLGRKMTSQFIRGGSSASPIGLYASTATSNKFDMTSTINAENVISDLGKLKRTVKSYLRTMRKPGWLMSDRTFNYLELLRDSNGFWLFRDELQQGKLLGLPVKPTAAIPDNLGTGGDESEIYFGDFYFTVFGKPAGFNTEVEIVKNGSYWDGSKTVSTTSTDETIVKVLDHHGFGLLDSKAFAIMNKVKWGA